jgi:Cdc6-like AAA superfamily ATPase
METYKNVLANKFMRDTNYIIIKDTDDLEELERQYELFVSQLTPRQQRLSDDRSIEIWNMTNQEHYESLKIELMSNIDAKYGDDNEEDMTSYEFDDESIEDDEISDSITSGDFDEYEIPDDDNDITTPVKEDSSIPVEVNSDTDFTDGNYYRVRGAGTFEDVSKDKAADQYEIDTNINIVGSIKGLNHEDYLKNLEKAFHDFNSQSHDHRKKSDDKCREIYGMSNIERYNDLKAKALKCINVEKQDTIHSSDGENLITTKLEFVNQVYNNMQAINESESIKANQHRRFNDTPYFTPTELIDIGVHGNHNFYCKDADNDGLITNVKVATWFDSYKDMCLDHIFEDYRKDWIDTLDMLYSDFDDIKSSGDEEKILARKQSILDLGWNPEIPFNRKNRLKASERVSKILDETIPRDIFINLDDIISDEDIVEEQATSATHKPVLLIFTQGKTPLVSQGIKFFTGSTYSHASISFDPTLGEVYSYNMRGENFGFVRENLSSFKDNIISVMAFFAPNNIVDKLKEKVEDFKNNKTTFDLRIFFNKILHIDHKVSKNEYNQVCSTFVDTVLKSGGINLVGDIEIPDPGQLYTSAKSVPNKIIEVFNDIATKYNGKRVENKMKSILKKGFISIEEAVSDLKSHEYNDSFYNIELWESGESNLMWITGLSGSGKSTIAKEICESYDAEYVELDRLQRAKVNNWDTTKCEVIDSYISSKGGLSGIFTSLNNLEEITFENIVSDGDMCVKEFNGLFEYIFKYANSHKNKRFVIEGVQIAHCANKQNTTKISKCPVIIKNNGVFKTEFRREMRTIKYGIDNQKNFFDIMKTVATRNVKWIKGKFYIDDWNLLKDFKGYMKESVLVNKDDIKLNIELLAPNSDHNILFITGHSGAGKTTLIDEYSKKYNNSICVSGDNITIVCLNIHNPDSKWHYPDGDKFNGGKIPDILIEYFAERIDFIKNTIPDNLHGMKDFDSEYITEVVIDFLQWFKNKLNTSQYRGHIGIFEGTQVLNLPVDYIQNEPCIIKGTSMLTSYTRKQKRDVKPGKKLSAYKRSLIDMIPVYLADEKKINRILSTNESTELYHEPIAILNEVKRFPIEFDKEGNLIIYKSRIGSLAFGDEIADSVQLLEVYRNSSNVEGMKYELAKLWYINDCIEKKLKKRLNNDQYKELIDTRATCLNVFKSNLDYVMKAEKGFNFSDYYNSTPFSDNSTKITANTLKYASKAITNMI